MTTLSPIKIILVDDDPYVRPTLRSIVEFVPRFKVVAETGGAEEALQHLRSNLEVDLALVDLRMRGINGIELTKQICTEFPHVAVLILSNEDREEYIREAKQAGARGYLLKETPWPKIVSTIENIIDDPVSKRLLTRRELQVLWHIGNGKLSKEIARILNIGPRTVGGHRQNIWNKLEIKSQFQLIIIATEYRKRHNKPSSDDD